MSTPYVDPFNTDFQKLLDDANEYATMQQQLEDAVTAYHTAYEKLLKEADPSKAFMLLFYLLSMQGFAQLDDTLGVDGAGLQIQGDMSKLGNDLENLTNQDDSKDPISAQMQRVKDEASHLDKMLDLLSPNAGTPGQNLNVQDALGSTASSSMYQQFLTVRGDILWTQDPNAHDDPTQNYNPTPVPTPSATGPRTYHFDVSDGIDPDPTKPDHTYLCSYAELQTDMSGQGDPLQANETFKKKTDAFNMNTSTTQSTNAASNALITNEKNTDTEIQAFVNDMMHAQSDVVSATIKAPR